MTPSQAYSEVRKAIKDGVLIRPTECNRCGIIPSPTSDGRAPIQAHHHDYNKPLDVEWICAKCHREETPLPNVMGAPTPGIRNGQAKLNDASVLSARRLRAQGHTFQSIADRFDVDKATIIRAVKGLLWKHVPFAATPQPAEGSTDE